MADGMTHLALAALPAPWIRWRLWPAVGLGTVLPDLVSRVPGLALDVVHAHVMALPEAAFWPWGVLHEPIGFISVAALLVSPMAPAVRWRTWAALCLGGALHLGLDVLQDHHGEGYRLLAPFGTGRYELGLVGSEATVTLAPGLAFGVVVALAVWSRRAARG